MQTYSLVDDAGGRFAIDADTGVITVADGTLLDFETASSHSILVRVTDQGGLSLEKTFTIQVLNVPEPPATRHSGGTIAENSANGAVVGSVHGVDPIPASCSPIRCLTMPAVAAINANTGVITVANSSLLDFETARFHTISVRVTDALGATFDKNFTLGVSNVVEVPVAGDGHVSTTKTPRSSSQPRPGGKQQRSRGASCR